MTIVQLAGYIDENGLLEIIGPVDLPPGDVTITIEPMSAEDEASDDAHWEKSFADPRSKGLLAKMASKARANRDAGLNQELDPDIL